MRSHYDIGVIANWGRPRYENGGTMSGSMLMLEEALTWLVRSKTIKQPANLVPNNQLI